MPVEIACPNCSKSYTVPSAAIGKKVKCNCGKTFVAEEPGQLEEANPFEQFGEFDIEPPEPEPLPRRVAQATVETKETATAEEPPRNPWRNRRTSTFMWDRYPNLDAAINWVRFFASAQLVIAVIGFGIYSLGAFLNLPMIVQHGSPGALVVVVAGEIVAAFWLVISIAAYFVIKAAVEFVSVIVNAEFGIRSMAIHSGAVMADEFA